MGARLSPGGTFVPAARTGPHTQEVPDPAPPHRRKTGTGEDGLGTRSPTRLLAANAPARYPFSCGETKAGRPPPAGTYRTGRGHGRAGAPEAPEESVAAAAAVAARSVSAPPMAANSNAGRVPAPRPPRLKERRCLGSLLPDRKQCSRAGSVVSTPTSARPGSLRPAPPNDSVRLRSSSLRIQKSLDEGFAPPARSGYREGEHSLLGNAVPRQPPPSVWRKLELHFPRCLERGTESPGLTTGGDSLKNPGSARRCDSLG